MSSDTDPGNAIPSKQGYGAKQPGTLLYKSDAMDLVAGFQTYRVTDINVDLPAKVTWTVEFNGVDNDNVSSGRTAALMLAGKDVVGTSLDCLLYTSPSPRD